VHVYVPHNGYAKQSESTHILYISMPWTTTIIQNSYVVTWSVKKVSNTLIVDCFLERLKFKVVRILRRVLAIQIFSCMCVLQFKVFVHAHNMASCEHMRYSAYGEDLWWRMIGKHKDC